MTEEGGNSRPHRAAVGQVGAVRLEPEYVAVAVIKRSAHPSLVSSCNAMSGNTDPL